MTDDYIDIKATDEDGNDLEDTLVTVNGEVPGLDDLDGAPDDLTYITAGDESNQLANSEQHSTLSGTDLHDPAEHDNAHHAETYAVDGDSQPPEVHNADLHSHAELIDGDGIHRKIWVIPAGGDDPADADADDIIFEEE